MNKQQRAYTILRDRILDGEYGPGYRLVIDSLAEEFGYSALPVREAIRRLEAEGLIVFRPNAGAQVAPADPREFAGSIEVLAVLEGYATAAAAPEVTAADLDRLREANAAMTECMERLDPLGFSQANRTFHLTIYERCPNTYLVEILLDTERRLDTIRRTVFTHIPYRGRASITEHEKIVELLAAGASPDRIEREARQHKLRTLDAFRGWQTEHEPNAASENGAPGASESRSRRASSRATRS